MTRVSNGDEALTKCQDTGACQFDLIILDYYLPRKTGPEVAATLKAWGVMSLRPVVVLSAKLPDAERRRLAHLGVTLVGEKPSGFVELCDLARQLAALSGA